MRTCIVKADSSCNRYNVEFLVLEMTLSRSFLLRVRVSVLLLQWACKAARRLDALGVLANLALLSFLSSRLRLGVAKCCNLNLLRLVNRFVGAEVGDGLLRGIELVETRRLIVFAREVVLLEGVWLELVGRKARESDFLAVRLQGYDGNVGRVFHP